MASHGIVRTGRLIARPNLTELPRRRRGGPGSGSTTKAKTAKAGLKGGKGQDVSGLDALKTKMKENIPDGFKDPTADRYK